MGHGIRGKNNEFNLNRKKPRLPNLNDIDNLLSYLPYFQDTGNEFYSVISKPGYFPFISYSSKVNAFFHDIYNKNRQYMFYGHSELNKYIKNPDLLNRQIYPSYRVYSLVLFEENVLLTDYLGNYLMMVQ